MRSRSPGIRKLWRLSGRRGGWLEPSAGGLATLSHSSAVGSFHNLITVRQAPSRIHSHLLRASGWL